MKMQIPNPITYRQMAELCNACTTPEQAAELLAELVRRGVEDGRSEEEALDICRSNIGYLGGYYDVDTQRRWQELFGAVHPIFGVVDGPKEPKTAEEAFQLGVQAAVSSRVATMQAAGLCPRGGEIVDYTIGLCSCMECPTPRPGWVAK